MTVRIRLKLRITVPQSYIPYLTTVFGMARNKSVSTYSVHSYIAKNASFNKLPLDESVE